MNVEEPADFCPIDDGMAPEVNSEKGSGKVIEAHPGDIEGNIRSGSFSGMVEAAYLGLFAGHVRRRRGQSWRDQPNVHTISLLMPGQLGTSLRHHQGIA